MKLSVITPSFNQPGWLKLCVASVRDQVPVEESSRLQGPGSNRVGGQPVTSRALCVEHIIQDGGSGEETMALLQAWSRESASLQLPYQFHFSSETDRGMYDAINKGLAKATGDVCAWLNCDEQYLPGALAFVSDFFEKNPATDVLLGDAVLLDKKMKPVSYRRIMVPGLWHTRLDHLHSLSCAMFFRKSVLPMPPLDPTKKIIGDALLMDHFLQKKVKIKTCGIPLSVYVVTGQNLSWSQANGEEMRDWRKGLRWPPEWCRVPVVSWHRLRRLFAGAYAKRFLQIAVYTGDSPESRDTRMYHGGGFWPHQLNLF